MKRGAMGCLIFGCLCLLSSVVLAAGTVTYAKRSICNARNGCLDRHRWTFTEAGGAAVDATATADIQGKIVGVRVWGTFAAATTIKLLDADGRDVLQGLFSDTEATAAATADNRYRVPLEDTNGWPIWLFEGDIVYLDVSSGDGTDTGYVDVLALPFD